MYKKKLEEMVAGGKNNGDQEHIIMKDKYYTDIASCIGCSVASYIFSAYNMLVNSAIASSISSIVGTVFAMSAYNYYLKQNIGELKEIKIKKPSYRQR